MKNVGYIRYISGWLIIAENRLDGCPALRWRAERETPDNPIILLKAVYHPRQSSPDTKFTAPPPLRYLGFAKTVLS